MWIPALFIGLMVSKNCRPTDFGNGPDIVKMLGQHLKRRDPLVEGAQTYITDVDNCIECMCVCPVGEKWKKIRPRLLLPQKSGGTAT